MPKARTHFRNRGFDAFSQCILTAESGRLLSPTGWQPEVLMLSLRSDSDRSPLVFLRGTDTVDLTRAAPAGSGGELDLDHLILPVVDGRRPADTVLSCGADGLLMFPVDEELAGIKTLLRVGLPLDIATRRTNHFDPALLEARPE